MKLLGSIYIAIALLVMTTAIGWYVDIHNEQMHEHHLAVHTQLEHMARLQQELNGMLTTAVLEENTLRASTYDRVGADLDSTLQSVCRSVEPSPATSCCDSQPLPWGQVSTASPASSAVRSSWRRGAEKPWRLAK